MEISKATNQQLYAIAKGENRRLKDRYSAAHELQRRKRCGQEKQSKAEKKAEENT